MSIVNRVLCALKLQKYVDARTLSRISGVCLDFLVVAAVSSIRLDVIVDHAMSMLLGCWHKPDRAYKNQK